MIFTDEQTAFQSRCSAWTFNAPTDDGHDDESKTDESGDNKPSPIQEQEQ